MENININWRVWFNQQENEEGKKKLELFW